MNERAGIILSGGRSKRFQSPKKEQPKLSACSIKPQGVRRAQEKSIPPDDSDHNFIWQRLGGIVGKGKHS